MRLEFSKSASRDIEEIYLYGFLTFGEKQTDSYTTNMQYCLETIRLNPLIGRLDERVNPAIRRFEFQSHIVCYDIYSDTIKIIRILHKSVDFPNQF